MAFLNKLGEKISGFFHTAAEKFVGLFSSANMQTVSKPSAGYELAKTLMLDGGKKAISHLDNLITETKTLQEENGGLTASDIVGFVRENKGSNANLRTVITGMSSLNGNQLIRTGPAYAPNNEAFFQDIKTAFETKGNALYTLKDEMTKLLETDSFVEGLDMPFQSCASTTEKELQEKLDTVKDLTNEQLGEAFITRLGGIKTAYENHIGGVESYLESIKN